MNILLKAHQYDDELEGDGIILGDAMITEIRLEYDEQGDISKVGYHLKGRIKFGSDISIYGDYDITALTVHEIAHVLGFEYYGMEKIMDWNTIHHGTSMEKEISLIKMVITLVTMH